jgi:hypothetical protein
MRKIVIVLILTAIGLLLLLAYPTSRGGLLG